MPRTQLIPTCHPEQKHFGRGLCYECYKAWLRKSGEGRKRKKRWYEANREYALADSRERGKKKYATPKGKHENRNDKFKRKFGITVEDYELRHAFQGGVCAICKNPETAVQRYGLKRLALDHCHTTGKIRGLLCQRCNQMIGHGGDNIELLKAAIAYLES